MDDRDEVKKRKVELRSSNTLEEGPADIHKFPQTQVVFLDKAARERARDPQPTKGSSYDTLYESAVRRQKEKAAMTKRSRVELPKK